MKKPRKLEGIVSHVVCTTKEAEKAFHNLILTLPAKDVWIDYEQSRLSWQEQFHE